ncbi:unnamed protein product [Prunus armeniaca]
MPKYNWVNATSDFLERQLVKDCKNPTSVSGCVVALLVFEDLCKTPDVGNMSYKFGSAALKHGTETNASDLRSSSVITSVASGKVANNIVVELDPPNMFQLIPTQDTGFHGVVNDYGHDDSPKTPTKSNFDIEGRLKECLLLLENERSNNSENKVMKEEISKLNMKLEEAQVQAVMCNELCCNAEFIVADEHKQYDELSNDL